MSGGVRRTTRPRRSSTVSNRLDPCLFRYATAQRARRDAVCPNHCRFGRRWFGRCGRDYFCIEDCMLCNDRGSAGHQSQSGHCQSVCPMPLWMVFLLSLWRCDLCLDAASAHAAACKLHTRGMIRHSAQRSQRGLTFHPYGRCGLPSREKLNFIRSSL